MNVLKRPEVWILILIGLVAAVYVLRMGGGGDNDEGGAGKSDALAKDAGRLRIEKMELTRDYSNGRLDIWIAMDNRGGLADDPGVAPVLRNVVADPRGPQKQRDRLEVLAAARAF